MHSLYGEEKMTTKELLIKAKNAKAELGLVSVEKINEALLAMADCLVEDTAEILRNNAEDIEKARGTVSDVMLDRLSLSEERIEGMDRDNPESGIPHAGSFQFLMDCPERLP